MYSRNPMEKREIIISVSDNHEINAVVVLIIVDIMERIRSSNRFR